MSENSNPFFLRRLVIVAFALVVYYRSIAHVLQERLDFFLWQANWLDRPPEEEASVGVQVIVAATLFVPTLADILVLLCVQTILFLAGVSGLVFSAALVMHPNMADASSMKRGAAIGLLSLAVLLNVDWAMQILNSIDPWLKETGVPTALTDSWAFLCKFGGFAYGIGRFLAVLLAYIAASFVCLILFGLMQITSEEWVAPIASMIVIGYVMLILWRRLGREPERSAILQASSHFD
jgi:hypothetical protein